MLRRGLALLPIVCLLCAACGSSTKTGTPAVTTAPTTTLASDNPQPAVIPTTPTVVTTGRQSAFVLSVDLVKHTVTFDPMRYLTGQAATDEFKKTNPAASHGPDNDYVIVNDTKDAFVRPLAADAVVKVVRVGGVPHTQPVAIPQAQLKTYPGLGNSPFWLTFTNGTVTEIDEQFVP